MHLQALPSGQRVGSLCPPVPPPPVDRPSPQTRRLPPLVTKQTANRVYRPSPYGICTLETLNSNLDFPEPQDPSAVGQLLPSGFLFGHSDHALLVLDVRAGEIAQGPE